VGDLRFRLLSRKPLNEFVLVELGKWETIFRREHLIYFFLLHVTQAISPVLFREFMESTRGFFRTPAEGMLGKMEAINYFAPIVDNTDIKELKRSFGTRIIKYA
jgi:hypothetical protein